MESRADDGFKRAVDTATVVTALAMVIYHMASAHYLFVGHIQHQTVHLAFAMLLVFFFSLKKTPKRLRPLGLLLIVATVITTVYVFVNSVPLQLRAGSISPPVIDLVIGGVLIALVIEACRRSFGMILTGVIVVFLVYIFVGHYLPRPFYIPAYSPLKIISRLGIGSIGLTGVYSVFVGISANTIFLFVVFGSLLQVSGATRFFMQVGRIFGRKLAGGPAISAVVSSTLVGMVTGSVGADIATTGSFTVPLMKKVGYAPYQAGAVIATASTGAQLMPPVMGAAAFLMADLTGTPYVLVMGAAFLPAFFFFLAAGLYTQLYGMRMRFSGIPDRVDVREMALTAPLFLVPLAFLTTMLLLRYSLNYSMSISIVLLLVLSFLRKDTRPSLKKLVEGFTEGAYLGAQIGATVAALGIIIGIVSWTGLGIKIPSLVEGASGGNLTIALLLTMVASLILGMGLPSTAVYLMVAVVVGPALIKMGVPMFQAHFFCFYFGVMSFVTPPVAMAALIAAKVSGSPFLKTGIEATKVAIGGFLVPFFIIWTPILTLQPQEPVGAAVGLTALLLTIVSIQIVICKYYLADISRVERLMYAAVTLVIFFSQPLNSYPMFALGVGVFVLGSVWQWRKRQFRKKLTAVPAL
ncbi:MAG: TRAP transporter fused permease subunit [Chloroflexota bacterium]